MSVTRWGKVGILWLLAAGCAESTPTCGDLIEDRTLGRCVCPEGTTPTDDGWGCLLPDGGAIRNPNAPDAAVGPDAGSEDACVGCVCTEGATRECATGAMGVCSPGAQRCMEGAWSPCVSLQEATPETCNGLDDDCNGAPDDGTATTSCGATDRVRSAGCSGGACFVADCAPGFLDCDRRFDNGCEEELGSPSACLSCGDVCGWSCEADGCNDPRRISTGLRFSAVVRADRTLAGWGRNDSGQIGDGTRGERLRPVPSLLTDVEDLALGSEHACALSGGEVWCWGEGGSGQLGVGIVDDTIVPVRAFVGARHLSAGQSHSCVVDTSQAIWCWGALTFGGQAFHAEPTRVPGVSGVQVTSGVGHACARASSGTVRCWGTNTQGVLGSGSYAGPDAVTTVAELNDASLVSAGDYFNCAVRAEGKVVCWGLGGGVQSAALVEVEGLDSVERLDAGGASACAIRADESLWCWGTNSFGEVGDGTTQRRVRAVRVLDSVADVSVGYSHTCAVLVDGGVRCWGTNDAGELGTGTREPVAEPADVLAP